MTRRAGHSPAARNVIDRVVGIAELRVTSDITERLVTYALGSCLGITIYDAEAGVAGLLHVMLPASSLDAAKAADRPAMFVDTGVTLLFRECHRLGARKQRMVVKVAGGAFGSATEAEDRFQIGKRNFAALRQLLAKNGIPLVAHDVGGRQISRTMIIDASSGDVTLKVNGQERKL